MNKTMEMKQPMSEGEYSTLHIDSRFGVAIQHREHVSKSGKLRLSIEKYDGYTVVRCSFRSWLKYHSIEVVTEHQDERERPRNNHRTLGIKDDE